MIPLVVLELNLIANPPLSRDMVFSDTIDFPMEKVTVSGVRNDHTRLLLHSAETTPNSWRNWQGVVDSVVVRGWDGWKTDGRLDSSRFKITLSPCATCAQNIRVPINDSTRYAGTSENRWGRWNPCSHTTGATKLTTGVHWEISPTVAPKDPTYVGRGVLSPSAALSFECTLFPNCLPIWCTTGPCRSEILSDADDWSECFSKKELRVMATRRFTHPTL